MYIGYIVKMLCKNSKNIVNKCEKLNSKQYITNSGTGYSTV